MEMENTRKLTLSRVVRRVPLFDARSASLAPLVFSCRRKRKSLSMNEDPRSKLSVFPLVSGSGYFH